MPCVKQHKEKFCIVWFQTFKIVYIFAAKGRKEPPCGGENEPVQAQIIKRHFLLSHTLLRDSFSSFGCSCSTNNANKKSTENTQTRHNRRKKHGLEYEHTQTHRNRLLASSPLLVSTERRERTQEHLQTSPNTHRFHDRATASSRETQGRGECRRSSPVHSWRRRKSCRKRKKWRASSAGSSLHSRPIQSPLPPARTADSESQSPAHQSLREAKTMTWSFRTLHFFSITDAENCPKIPKTPAMIKGYVLSSGVTFFMPSDFMT